MTEAKKGEPCKEYVDTGRCKRLEEENNGNRVSLCAHFSCPFYTVVEHRGTTPMIKPRA